MYCKTTEEKKLSFQSHWAGAVQIFCAPFPKFVPQNNVYMKDPCLQPVILPADTATELQTACEAVNCQSASGEVW